MNSENVGVSVTSGRVIYPFTAFVDQELLKRGLILLAINPKIGGLLIRGEKGSGKSTIARAIADLLPEIEVVKGCPFNCNPHNVSNMCDNCKGRYLKGEKLPVEKKKMRVITLPLGATEDRVLGTIDIERVLKEGTKALQLGILGEANQNILYIDEINLLPDHLVDDILDASASGWNVVEREGISIAHPSRFILIGTMNPEEGDLRPQLLDRLSMSVTIVGVQDETKRVEIIKRNIEFVNNPTEFVKKYEQSQKELRERIIEARKRLSSVNISDELMYTIAKLNTKLSIDGHRPDIIIAMAAKANAAFEGRTEVTIDDIELAAQLTLGHRTRSGGLAEPATPDEISSALKESYTETKKFFR